MKKLLLTLAVTLLFIFPLCSCGTEFQRRLQENGNVRTVPTAAKQATAIWLSELKKTDISVFMMQKQEIPAYPVL